MEYEHDILYILTVSEKEDGVSVKAIAKHVYNKNCGFFTQLDFRTLHKQISHYLWRMSRRRDTAIDHGPRWGRYVLNPHKRGMVVQLFLPFEE